MRRFRAMVGLLRERDGLDVVAELHLKPLRRRRDREITVAHATDEVEGLLRRLVQREPERVLMDLRLHGGAHGRRGPEETIGRGRAVDPLVRPSEIVVLDVELETPLTVGVVGEHGPGQEFLPERLPETFDLAERLRVLWPALDVVDPLPPKRLRELGFATPGGVLTAVVREDLGRHPVGGDPAFEGFHDERGPLVMGDGVPDDVPRVVVHEDGDVEPLVPAVEEREDVRLPELVRRRPLEPPGEVLTFGGRRRRLRDPLGVQRATHRSIAHPDPFEPGELVADAPAPPVWVLLPDPRHDGLEGVRCLGLPLRFSSVQGTERLRAALRVELHVLLDRGRRDPERHRHRRLLRPPQHLTDDQEPQLHREAVSFPRHRSPQLPLSLPAHLSSLPPRLGASVGEDSANGFEDRSDATQVARRTRSAPRRRRSRVRRLP